MIREIGARTTDNGEGGEMKNSEYGEYLLTKEWRKFRELAPPGFFLAMNIHNDHRFHKRKI